jgi:hypothetical protein
VTVTASQNSSPTTREIYGRPPSIIFIAPMRGLAAAASPRSGARPRAALADLGAGHLCPVTRTSRGRPLARHVARFGWTPGSDAELKRQVERARNT